jgi:spoIIIJ-associated protein
MIDQNDIQKIKDAVATFFQKATISVLNIEILSKENELDRGEKDVIDLNIKLSEPQILIGEKGQTLFETQRLLKIILNKNLGKIFYLNLDINDYKKKKSEYLKNIAKDLANEVTLNKQEKILVPMSSYERKIIHAELSNNPDVITESRGDGFERHIVIKPK